ncbi:hypothetical protein MPTK1_2g01280 [Marchantia polymorpha subsp. ruderalis]|uniref:Uncharacterized protein n=1 Tax=Marchantia polymorpha TaxID=3197 RepID=A0A2R6X9B8_MARPO|nr:hypothetical protein MARPO_0028s0024 [Marchantia polymorpha]BBN00698.1 hypothetical protein Mp_2g01280 [Marchantia polymorpha subsp. ruderalis]|eukprot:PTQ42698.1 hypothetical protein MARPO_0028s0024 [Marchantia polymorpha]
MRTIEGIVHMMEIKKFQFISLIWTILLIAVCCSIAVLLLVLICIATPCAASVRARMKTAMETMKSLISGIIQDRYQWK